MAQSRLSGNVQARSGKAWSTALLVILTLVVYGSSVRNEFVSLDDPIYVTENPHVNTGITAAGLRWSLTATTGGNWHPLTWWSHMVDVQLFGMRAGGHHLTSVLLHAAAGAVLFHCLCSMSGTIWPSLLASALFVAHPLHVESVAWVSERKDVLAGLCWIAALGAYVHYVRRPSPGRNILTVLFFSLGLMAKPMVVTFPLVLLILDYWPLGRLAAPTLKDILLLMREKALLLVLAVTAALLAIAAQYGARAVETMAGASLPFLTAVVKMRLANALHSYAVYLAQAVWPSNLAVFYPFPAHSLELWRLAAAGLTVAGTSVFAVFWRHRSPSLAAGWLWYLVTLLPVIGLFQVGAQARADRYTYLPLIGVFVAASWGFLDFSRGRRSFRSVFFLSAVIAVTVFAAISMRQVRYWRDTKTLFRHALDVTKGNYQAERIFGKVLLGEGNFGEAEMFFRRALKLSPSSPVSHNLLGLALSSQGRLDEAIAEYRKAVRLDPAFSEAHSNLGVDLTAKGQLQEGAAHLRTAVRLSPEMAEVHFNLGDNLELQGRTTEAMRSYRRALELKPDLTPAQFRLERLRNQGETTR